MTAPPLASARLGQLAITFEPDAVVVAGPAAAATIDLPADPAVLRDWARFDALGRYRPLPGGQTLRGGWQARFPTIEAAAAAIDAIYPLAQAHLAQWEEGTLRVVPLDDVLARQQGRYRSASALSPRGRDVVASVLCGQCVKAPAWRDVRPAAGEIPCPEPCSVLVSLCREAAAWEAGPPGTASADAAIPFAAFDVPGNEVREACLALMEGTA